MHKYPLFFAFYNSVSFYLGWYLIVTSAAHQKPWLGLFAALLFILIHILVVRHKLQEILLILFSLALGFCLETLFMKFHILRYSSPNLLFPEFPPFWILGIYALFATTINHSLKWMGRHIYISSAAGCAGAIFSYLAGERLGAATLLVPNGGSLIVIGIFWSCAVPLTSVVNEKLKHLLVSGTEKQ